MKHTVEKYMALKERVDRAREAEDKAYARFAKLLNQLQKVTNETEWDSLVFNYKGVNYILYVEDEGSWKSSKKYAVKEVKEAQ